MKKKERISFDDFYFDIYKDRWQGLKESFGKEKENVNLSEELRHPYFLDPASKMVASLLPVKKGDRVLDMCAAPGGKTLSIALRLSGEGELVSNDRSPKRRQRLKSVLDECLSKEDRSIISIKGYDASSWCLYEKEAYDEVLLDAPCSSERHVYLDAKHLSIWSPSRPKRLAKEQYALLSSALIVVKKGGCILYSTCSINPEEDEGVVSRLFKKHESEVEEIPFDLPFSEPLEHGAIILPDRADGLGPMYACLLRKKK